jgi:hypothetical protein
MHLTHHIFFLTLTSLTLSRPATDPQSRAVEWRREGDRSPTTRTRPLRTSPFFFASVATPLSKVEPPTPSKDCCERCNRKKKKEKKKKKRKDGLGVEIGSTFVGFARDAFTQVTVFDRPQPYR